MPRLSRHGKLRIVERNSDIDYIYQAKKEAHQAYTHGKTVGEFQKYPEFFIYLQGKRKRSRSCTLRVYHNNIYIWRGEAKTLVTSHPIPDRYLKEMEAINECLKKTEK